MSVRIHQLSKQIGIENKELIELLQQNNSIPTAPLNRKISKTKASKSTIPETKTGCPYCGEKHLADDPPCQKRLEALASNAMNFVRIAITQLERISINDPDRENAFIKLEKWIQSERQKRIE